MSERLTSRRNPLVLRFVRALEGLDRSSFLLEGVRLLEEALEAGIVFEAVLVSPRLEASERGRVLRANLERAEARVLPATDEVVDRASGAKTHQGVVALAPRPEVREDALLPAGVEPFLLVAAGIQDPGNLGAVLRVAEAAGATGVLVTEGSANPWHERAVRASSGAILRLPVSGPLPVGEVAAFLKRRKLRAVASDPREGTDYREADFSGPLALLLGSEGRGLPEALLAAADLRVRIPIRGRVESLNVAAAAALLAFEAARRREAAPLQGKTP